VQSNMTLLKLLYMLIRISKLVIWFYL